MKIEIYVQMIVQNVLLSNRGSFIAVLLVGVENYDENLIFFSSIL